MPAAVATNSMAPSCSPKNLKRTRTLKKSWYEILSAGFSKPQIKGEFKVEVIMA